MEALGAGAHDIDYYTHYYCYDAPEASDNFLQDGNMTVEGLVSFYKNVLKKIRGRAKRPYFSVRAHCKAPERVLPVSA